MTIPRITVNPKIRFGKPCIRGTRIAVVDILSLLRAGFSIREIPSEYPGLTPKDVLAAIDYAGKLADAPAKIFSKTFAA